MSKARITYRFDGNSNMPAPEDNGTLPEFSANDKESFQVIPLYKEDVDAEAYRHGGRKNPFDEEAERIAHLIRSADPKRSIVKETEEQRPQYYTAEDADTTFDRIPFFEEPLPAAPQVVVRRARKQTNWFGIATAVMGAVLTGIVLGMFVLSFFRGEPSDPPAAALSGEAAGGAELPGLDAETGKAVDQSETLPLAESNDGFSAPLERVAVQLPEWTLFFVQNGVFSSPEGADMAAAELKDKGLAGAVENGDKLAVYAGAAIDRDDALLISHHLQEEGLEIYIKPYALPAASHADWPGEAGELQDYFLQSRNLMTSMIAASLQHVSESAPGAIPEEQMNQLKADHQQWTAIANSVLEQAPAEMKAWMQDMNKAANTAMSALEQYYKKPSAAYMWQVQSAVMEHVIKQKQLLEQTNAMI